MSTLLMVRHGQASFGASDYDKLSELGAEQSRRLGEYFVRRGCIFDAVYTGSQRRQKETFDEVAKAFHEYELDFPQPVVSEHFDEYDARGIMTHLFPRLQQTDERLMEIIKSASDFRLESPSGRKTFQEIFEIVMNRYIEGDTEVEGLESWKSFKERVVRGITEITEAFEGGKTVAVFTSGGPISVAIGYALDLSSQKALQLNWVVRNSSITEFIFKPGRFTLTGFNMTPHIREDSLVTYR